MDTGHPLTQMQILRYSPQWKETWNRCVRESRNGTFLFLREYMDYHNDRFQDASILFKEDEKIIGLLPANWVEAESTIFSHQGLTYGGLILTEKATSAQVLEMIDRMLAFYREQYSAKRLVYKPIPYIYSSYPSQEDLYALWRHSAVLTQRLLSSSIMVAQPLKFSHSRKAGFNKAIRNKLYVEQNLEPQDFWVVLEEVLKEHHYAKPVHTLQEMRTLMRSFPQEIQLFTVKKDKRVIAGTILYVTPNVVHTQYIASNAEGRNNRALDLLFKYLIEEKFKHMPFFDFGTSNEDAGRYLNASLIAQKESFGGRGVAYDTYCINMP